MPTPDTRTTSEEESRRVAEQARAEIWEGHGFLRDLFLGRLSLELIHPFPITGKERPDFTRFVGDMRAFLREHVDPVAIDQSGEYPPTVLAGLRRLGAFGMKIPREYGGLGFTVSEYCRAMELVGSYDGNIAAVLSAHQSIGVPQPLKLFGTAEQKAKYLPRCAAGALSAFALTEPGVGSDPASLATTALRHDDHFVLNGEKLWCTNGTLAELLVVMARDPQSHRISAFIVETGWEGVTVECRCRFMELRALANGVITFRGVRVPRENLIGREGQGLKIALATLNTGRLTLPAVCAGAAKRCLEICRGWAAAREQWGVPIWKHEVIGNRIAEMAATAFAMDSVATLAAELADRGGYDIRLEAAAAKEWNTVRAWELADRTLQIRGGRGYETEPSLAGRGEAAIGVERMLRDLRINLIFEGSSEIMHLFMAREAVDKHLEIAGALIDPRRSAAEKRATLPRVAAFYARWYPSLWLRGLGAPARFGELGPLAPHLRFVERSARRLARASFHGMLWFRAGMERKQAFLFRSVDIAMERGRNAAGASRRERVRGCRWCPPSRARSRPAALGVGLEEVPDERGGIEVAADAADQHLRQVLAAPGPGVPTAVEAHQGHLAAVPPARVDGPEAAAAVRAGAGGEGLPHRIPPTVERGPATRGLLGVDDPAAPEGHGPAVIRHQRVARALEHEHRDRLLRPEPRLRRVGDAAHHRGDGRDARGQVRGQVVREDGAVRDSGGVDPPRVHRVHAADRVDQRGHEAHVVDVVSMGARARELPAVVPVLAEALREGDEEALAVGQRREAGEALGAGAVAAAPVEDEHEGCRGRGKGRRHVEVIAAGDPVDLEGVGRERALRPLGGRGRHEPGQGEGQREPTHR